MFNEAYNIYYAQMQVKGQVNGRTVLPMPAGLEKVTEVERLVSAEGPQAVDLYLKSAIEGVVIKWAYLVNDVVTHESGIAFENGQNPTPNIELEYWSTRLANLRYLNYIIKVIDNIHIIYIFIIILIHIFIRHLY